MTGPSRSQRAKLTTVGPNPKGPYRPSPWAAQAPRRLPAQTVTPRSTGPAPAQKVTPPRSTGAPAAPGRHRAGPSRPARPAPVKAQPGSRLDRLRTSAASHAQDLSRAGEGALTRQAVQGTAGPRPSIIGAAVAGGAAGAPAGPAGMAAGAAIGGAGGRAQQKAWRRARRDPAIRGPRQALMAEMILCMVIIALAPLTDRRRQDPPGAFIIRLSATMLLFLLLSIIGASSGGSARMAAAFGGLVTVTLAVSERDVFAALAAALNRTPEGTGVAGVGQAGKPLKKV